MRIEYQYDAFGNRTSLTEGDTSTTYSYDVLDRLLEVNELNNNQSVVKTYDYDKRGNQTNEYVDGVLNKTFTFDATGMMSKVTDAVKGQQENLYNGLGFRVETTRPEEHIEYLCDLSKDYFNLLERTVNGEKESFVYDKNVISMSKKGSNFYYLQDELGSPMYLTGTDGVAVSSYAFDDFGRNIDPRTGKQKHGYTKDGNIIQPFAFTGYQEDEFSGLKFAQARFYDARVGRFESRDKVKGFAHAPFTLNNYSYCFNNPLGLVDRDGNLPEWVENACDWVEDKASDAWDATCDFVDTYGDTIVNAAGTGIALAAGFAIGGPVGLAVVGSAVLVNGAVGGVSAYMKGEDPVAGTLNGLKFGGDAAIGAIGALDMVYSAPTSNKVEAGTISKNAGYVNDVGKEGIVFPENPNDFNPEGLVKIGPFHTKNGDIIKWIDENGKAVYEWDQDFRYGPHYHVIGPDGNTRLPNSNGETHFWPGDCYE